MLLGYIIKTQTYSMLKMALITTVGLPTCLIRFIVCKMDTICKA